MPSRRWAPAVSIRYVVDTSVAGAANRARGGESETAKLCRRYMLTLMNACHRMAMTDAIRLEWDHRASRWSQDWYLQMARKGKVRVVRPANCAKIEAGIDDSEFTAREKAALRKDIRLIAAALASDLRIVSLDTTSMVLFGTLARTVGDLESLTWIYPIDGSLPPHRG